MSVRSLKHLEALVRLADIELERDEYVSRSGVYRALLDSAMPYLRNALLDLLKERDRVNDDRWAQGLPEITEVTT